MTYNPGELIEAGDYATLIGPLNSNTAYVDAVSCINRMAALWGVGYGEYGYGQSLPFLEPATVASTVTGQQWLDLRTAMVKMALHQNTAISGFPDAAALQPGEPIAAGGYDWTTAIAAVSAASASVDLSLMVDTPNITSARTDPWTTLIQHEIEINFGTEDAARFFFNTGSQLRFSADLAGAPDALSLAWATMLNAMGQIAIGATDCSQTGSGGVAQPIGYRGLSNSYQTIFTQNLAAPYASNNITIQARADNIFGENGANGSIVRVLVQFNETSFGTVSGNITSRTSIFKPDGSAISIADPLLTNLQNLDGNAGLDYFVFAQTISSFVNNYNLLAAAQAAGYDGIKPLYATVTVASSGIVGSNSPDLPSFSVPVLPAGSEVLLTVNASGVVAGRGGSGGTGAPSGVCGCQTGLPGSNGGVALQLETPVLIQNFGIIGGGGGGGGGGGSECGYIWNASAGGGGGGAGFGPGGQINGCGVTAGRFGQVGETGFLLVGGSGGSPGNIYTARGGRGGDLGQPGEAGQSISSSGGIGGNSGFALVGNSFVFAGSVLGDIRGPVT